MSVRYCRTAFGGISIRLVTTKVNALAKEDSTVPEKLEKSAYSVGSVSKALNLVEHIMNSPRDGLLLSEIVQETEGSKSATFELLRTLVDHGYLRTTKPGPRYQLGMALIRLGDLASARDPIVSISRSILKDLSAKTGLTVRIARNDNGYPVFLERIDGPGMVRFYTPLGVRELPHISAVGKAILAQLPDAQIRLIAEESGLQARTPKSITTLPKLLTDIRKIRDRGYALDDEEDALSVFCVGAAFLDHSSICVGGISVTGIKTDHSVETFEKLGKLVLKHAEMITKALGGTAKIRS